MNEGCDAKPQRRKSTAYLSNPRPRLRIPQRKTQQLSWTNGSTTIPCGSWGSFNEQGMLGNAAMAKGFIERYPTIQLTNCLLQAGVLTNTKPAPANAANPGAGPACTVVPANLKGSSSFIFTMTTSYAGTVVRDLTPTELAAVITGAPTYWVWEESYIKLPNGLNAGLPTCT